MGDSLKIISPAIMKSAQSTAASLSRITKTPAFHNMMKAQMLGVQNIVASISQMRNSLAYQEIMKVQISTLSSFFRRLQDILPDMDFDDFSIEVNDDGHIEFDDEVFTEAEVGEAVRELSQELENGQVVNINVNVNKEVRRQSILVKIAIWILWCALAGLTAPVSDRLWHEVREVMGLNELYDQLFNELPFEIHSPVSKNVCKLEAMFPSAVKDGLLDAAALKEELGQFEEVDVEKYELTLREGRDSNPSPTSKNPPTN